MTKAEYIKNHPRSMLSENLKTNGWADTTPIEIVGGLDAPNNPRSNLAQALNRSERHEYAIGGHRQRGAEGWWFAVA